MVAHIGRARAEVWRNRDFDQSGSQIPALWTAKNPLLPLALNGAIMTIKRHAEAP